MSTMYVSHLIRSGRHLLVWLLLLLFTGVSSATVTAEFDGGVVRKGKDDWSLNYRSINDSIVVRHDGSSNATSDPAVVRRHDGAANGSTIERLESLDSPGSVRKESVETVIDSRGRVRKQLPGPARDGHMSHLPQGVALVIDASANVLHREPFDRDGDSGMDGVVRGAPVETQQPAPLSGQPGPPGQPGLPSFSDTLHHAIAIKNTLRHALVQLQLDISRKSKDGLIETVAVAVVVVLIGLIVLSAVTVAVSRYRERSLWSQSQAVAMMRAINRDTPQQQSQSAWRTPSQTSSSRGRRQSTGATPPSFSAVARASGAGATIRAASARRASTDARSTQR